MHSNTELPNELTAPQITIVSYLKKFIRECEETTLSSFLRFCSGSDIIIPDRKLTISFANTCGFKRMPVAYTCGFTIELAINYENCADFRSEMNSVLKSNMWIMDLA